MTYESGQTTLGQFDLTIVLAKCYVQQAWYKSAVLTPILASPSLALCLSDRWQSVTMKSLLFVYAVVGLASAGFAKPPMKKPATGGNALYGSYDYGSYEVHSGQIYHGKYGGTLWRITGQKRYDFLRILLARCENAYYCPNFADIPIV